MKIRILLLFLFFSLNSFAQEDEFNKFKEQSENEFVDFAKKNQEIFNSFVEKNDEEFANFLRNSWKLYKGEKPKEPSLKKKPTEKPVFVKKNKEIAASPEVKRIQVEEPQEIEEMNFGSSLPPIQKKEAVLKNKSSISINFFGLNPEFEFDPKLRKITAQGEITPDLIADFWQNASNCNHYNLVNDLMEFKLRHKLNDWAYYQLVGKVSSKIARESKAQAKLLKWFLLVKSRYDTKIGYNANNIYIMVASDYMIFSKNYFSLDNQNYFILDNDNVKSLHTYEENYPDAKRKLDFRVEESPILGKNAKSRNLKFNYISQKYNLKLNYNKSNIDFYNTIPQLDLPLYFNAGNSSDFSSSVVQNLKPLIEGMDEVSAVSFLLKFAQTSFEYKTDPQQFGYEKFFFAEETVFYPYSDCEDRSVFFSTLVQELLNLEVVGLEYPGHVTTAIKFSDQIKGDYLIYNGEKYIICDPTFVNAPVGMCMPQYINVKAKVIPLRIKSLDNNYQNEIRALIVAAGGNAKKANIKIDKNGNSYVVGSFNSYLSLNDKNLEATNDRKNIFVAKFNKQKELVWADKISGDEQLKTEFVKVNNNGSTYIAGKIGSKAQFGKKLITNQSNSHKVFIAKYDKNGNFEWIKTSSIPQKATSDYVFVAKYDSQGEEISSLLFEKNKGFNNYGISFTAKGNIILTSKLD